MKDLIAVDTVRSYDNFSKTSSRQLKKISLLLLIYSLPKLDHTQNTLLYYFLFQSLLLECRIFTDLHMNESTASWDAHAHGYSVQEVHKELI